MATEMYAVVVDPAMYVEERIADACASMLRARGVSANRANVTLYDYNAMVRRLGARVFYADADAERVDPYIELHCPTGPLRVTYDLTLSGAQAFIYREVNTDITTHANEVRLLRAPLESLSSEQLQQRYESEEGAALWAMARAQRTFAEISKRKDKA